MKILWFCKRNALYHIHSDYFRACYSTTIRVIIFGLLGNIPIIYVFFLGISHWKHPRSVWFSWEHPRLTWFSWEHPHGEHSHSTWFSWEHPCWEYPCSIWLSWEHSRQISYLHDLNEIEFSLRLAWIGFFVISTTLAGLSSPLGQRISCLHDLDVIEFSLRSALIEFLVISMTSAGRVLPLIGEFLIIIAMTSAGLRFSPWSDMHWQGMRP